MVVKDKNKAKAGQFYMLKHNGTTLLPRPISVCETNGETLTFVYAVVGNGTKEYADDLLAHTEDVLTQTLGGLEKNISEALKLMEMSIEDTLKTVQNSRKELK